MSLIRRYTDLLPSYLKGPNINRHSEIIDKQNKKIYEKLLLLSSWNELDRPILVERVQEEPTFADIHIHLNIPFPISHVYTDGFVNDINVEYTEDDMITNTVLSTTCPATEYPPVMPVATVTVETFEGITYRKGYRENDTRKGDIFDHDEFLDIVGNLMGIPRRLYKELNYTQEISSYENTYPKFFTKQLSDGANVGDLLTEDDYYYSRRLKKFTEEINNKPPLILMAELLYEWNNITMSSFTNRDTSLTEEMLEIIGEPVVCINTGSRYRNLDYTNMEELLAQYIPVTRSLYLTEPYLVDYLINEPDYVMGTITLSGILCGYNIMDYEEEIELYRCPFIVTCKNLRTNQVIEEIVYSNLWDNGINDIVSVPHTWDEIEMHVQYREEYGNVDAVPDGYTFVISGARMPTVLSTSVTATTIGSASIEATLTYNNQGISNAIITCKNGNDIVATGTTNSNGVANLDLSSLPAGEYSLTVKYDGNYQYRPSTATQNITIQKLSTNLSVTTVSTVAGSAMIESTLTSGGSGVNGASILCKNGNTTVATSTTNSSGVASLDLSNLTADTYTLTIEYAGDNTHSNTSTTHSITITNAPTPTNTIGKGQTTGWNSNMWSNIELPTSGQFAPGCAHSNTYHHPSILKRLTLTGDFILVCHMMTAHQSSWYFGLTTSITSVDNMPFKVSVGDTLNSSSIQRVFPSPTWDNTIPVTITRIGTDIMLEYNSNTYTIHDSSNGADLYFVMDKTGTGNIFIEYLETSEELTS